MAQLEAKARLRYDDALGAVAAVSLSRSILCNLVVSAAWLVALTVGAENVRGVGASRFICSSIASTDLLIACLIVLMSGSEIGHIIASL